jgi:hypothetical protein
MRKLARNQTWLYAILAVAALMLTQADISVFGGSAGRDFSRCVQSCNGTRKACQDACKTDCRELYAQGTVERNTCESGCSDICIDNSQECKDVCLNIKNAPSPEEP